MIKIVLLLVLAGGCWEKTVNKSTMMKMALKVEPQVDVLLPENLTAGIKCETYGPGCLGAFKARVRLVDLILVEFENQAQAKETAMKFGQWYAYNWMFDDVTGETVLEDFIQQAFGAQRALPRE